ncbi:glycosyltransferase family protein [Clostridium sp. HMP27]|uniref:cytidylyltransferase domain-containing protein n=1 Tax=Clostridium sp. HMP27 TaxID=1487921 RepID=UPI00052BBFCC|nr:glycosyltransferase family protein [Clostridium sp. HMP27]KGK86068.1 spore coat protein [Clostridium sp. HMP27]
MNLVIIQAHMASTRLPGKVMKTIQNKEILLHVYERCLKAKTADKVVIATSTNKENDEIEHFCNKHNIECFRGAESDVLDRYYQCAKLYNPNIIIRVTSDCPILEPKLIDYWVNNMFIDGVEFIEEEKELFTGFGLDIFTYRALIKMKKNAVTDKQKEHVVGYYYDNKHKFTHKIYPLSVELKYLYKNYRLTIDTKEDFDLIKEIYDKFYIDEYVDLKQVMDYLDNNRSLLEINKGICQKKYK